MASGFLWYCAWRERVLLAGWMPSILGCSILGRRNYLFSMDVKLKITFNVETIVSAMLRLTRK